MPGRTTTTKRQPILHDRELARAYHAERERLWAMEPLERVCGVVEVWLPVVVNGFQSP